MADGFMKMGRAMEIVIELARQNLADEIDHPVDAVEQEEALGVVCDWVVNNLGEDD